MCRLVEVLESDAVEGDTDLRRIGDSRVESQMDAASRIVARKVEAVDDDATLQAVHSL